jgi:hypothetical protein
MTFFFAEFIIYKLECKNREKTNMTWICKSVKNISSEIKALFLLRKILKLKKKSHECTDLK